MARGIREWPGARATGSNTACFTFYFSSFHDRAVCIMAVTPPKDQKRRDREARKAAKREARQQAKAEKAEEKQREAEEAEAKARAEEEAELERLTAPDAE
jgi:hypothetical protein